METTRWWLCIGALALAACGGGGDDDAALGTTDAGAATGNGSNLDDGTSATVAPGAGVDTAVDDDAGTAAAETTDEETTDDEDTDEADNDADEPGPALEPTVAFAIPGSSTSGTRGGTVAVSPTGDRVAAMSFDDGLIGSLTIFDAATVDELAATTDERLAGALFWAADDRLLSGATQGEVWAWDTTTLEPGSDEPLSSGDNFCGNSNGIMFDPGAGALFLLARDFCRIDVTTGDVIVHEAEPDLLGDLRVAIGGDEVFLKWVTDDIVLMTRTVDADTLETLADAEGRPNTSSPRRATAGSRS